MFKYAFFFFHCDLHSFKMLDNKWCSLHYVYIMSKETIEKKMDSFNFLIIFLAFF
jgi:hypothetical protein